VLDDSNIWTNHIDESNVADLLPTMCDAFNHSPFMRHNQFVMRVNAAGDDVECVVDMAAHLIGNVHFGILHGGVAATMLDSIGGLQGMIELFRRGQGDFDSRRKQVGRLATMDMRVDYLTAGKGKSFIATADVVRLGRKSCTCRMQMTNNTGKLIAVGTASYVY